jgi:type VI secretion system protein
MSAALYDMLRGRFDDGEPVDANDESALIRSVRDHLQRLLNARQGVLQHLPDYGLPDLPSLYSGLPYAADDIARQVRQTVERYEPRLQQVSVRLVTTNEFSCVVGVELAGELPGGYWARFQSRFDGGGGADVSVWALRDN